MKKAAAKVNWIEVVVVSAILGNLCVIAWPHFQACACKEISSEAKSVTGAFARAQGIFYTKYGKFAASIPELELGFDANASNFYEYRLKNSDQASFTFARAKTDNLKSYVVGTFLMPVTQDSDQRYSIIFCEANQAGTESIVPPLDGQTCAPGSKVYGKPYIK